MVVMAGCCLKVEVFLCLLLLWSAVAPDGGKKGGRTHYLLYSVNPGEGFNLRRDVYMRAATLVKSLNSQEASKGHGEGEGENWVLVLPPWPHLYHWKSRDIQQGNTKWEKFFDLQSLGEYVPVMEFEDYVKQKGTKVEEVREQRNRS